MFCKIGSCVPFCRNVRLCVCIAPMRTSCAFGCRALEAEAHRNGCIVTGELLSVGSPEFLPLITPKVWTLVTTVCRIRLTSTFFCCCGKTVLPQVPQQNNGYDCGVFILKYIVRIPLPTCHCSATYLGDSDSECWSRVKLQHRLCAAIVHREPDRGREFPAFQFPVRPSLPPTHPHHRAHHTTERVLYSFVRNREFFGRECWKETGFQQEKFCRCVTKSKMSFLRVFQRNSDKRLPRKHLNLTH